MWTALAIVTAIGLALLVFGFNRRAKAPPPPPPPRTWDVGLMRSRVIEKNGKVWEVVHTGWVNLTDHWEIEYSASEIAHEWLDRGKRGVLWVAVGKYVPLCNIELIENYSHEHFEVSELAPETPDAGTREAA